MQSNLIKLTIPFLLCIGASPAFAGNTTMEGWIIQGEGGSIVEGQMYHLYNIDQKAYPRLQDRKGLNLGWSDAPNNAMKVARIQPSSEPIKCGEVFALYAGKEWLMYEKQTIGLNLSSRTKLANGYHQWKFSSCGPEGTVVALNQPVALVNTVANSAVVGCERLWGVNLCWAEDVISFRDQNYRKADVTSLVDKARAPQEILNSL